MSDTYRATPSDAPDGLDRPTGTVETAKQEASAVTQTAKGAAKDVGHTAKDEAASVAHEAKNQLGDLYAQTRSEVSDQAARQQERVASGLRAFGDDLSAMARGEQTSGVASDLVQRLADRTGSAATWVGDRDPAGLMREVKAFARRRPAVFIAGAVIAGVVAGRLTRALAANASGDATGTSGTTPQRQAQPATAPPAVPTVAPVATTDAAGGAIAAGGYTEPGDYAATGRAATADVAATPADLEAGAGADDSPVYSHSAARWVQERGEDADERPDTV